MTDAKSRGEPVAKGTASLLAEQTEQMKALFPECFCEGKVDWEKLRAALGDSVDERAERYSFTWAGKRDAIRLLQTPSRATLVPARDESVDFDATENSFIEGDNLEVLKLFYKSYFGRVKMIDIDPPYNTGNDFVYPDNYADPLKTYLELTQQITSNPETSGRYHSAWLSMMYPRLFLARQLLSEDGVIFVHIDDHEVHNLRLLMNEIFGEENFICSLIWKRRQNVDSRAKTGVSVDHEYLVVYRKNDMSRLRGQAIDASKYSNPNDDPRGPWASDSMLGLATKEQRPNLHYNLVNPETGVVYSCPETGWRYSKETMARLIKEGRIIWPPKPTGRPRYKRYLADLADQFTGLSSVLETAFNVQGTRELMELFDGRDVIDFPKPADYIKLVVQQATTTNNSDIVLDFFAGSCTTAQAVLELNREDGGNRRFIMVQLPEPTGNKDYATIADIGKERIRRVIAKMKKESASKLDLKDREAPEDLGFKVFKLAESNYKPWNVEAVGSPAAYATQVGMFADPLVDGWKPENVIYEVAIKEGYGLNCRIERVGADLVSAQWGQPRGLPLPKTVYRVTDPDKEQSFYICLDDKVRLDALKPLELKRDDLFVCRDRALDDDAAANLALQCGRLKTI